MNTPVRSNTGFVRQLIDLFLFSSLFIAFCAVCMVYQTWHLYKIPVNLHFIFFVFFATLCSYNFHWYLTPAFYGSSYKTQWSIRYKNFHLCLFVIGLVGAGWFAVSLLNKWPWLLATAFITFLYSAPKIPFQPFIWLRSIAIGKTIFLSLVWTHCTVILPLVIGNAQWENSHFLFVINRFFFIYAICILFDFRDREQDKKEGVKSMITYFPEKRVDLLFYGSIAVFITTLVTLYFTGLYWLDGIILLLPGIILLSLYKYSKTNTSDYYYYFFLDGLMMFSAVLLFIIHF